jgi:hypothetical protein
MRSSIERRLIDVGHASLRLAGSAVPGNQPSSSFPSFR